MKNSAFSERYKFFERSSTKKCKFWLKNQDFAILTLNGYLVQRDVSPKKNLNLLVGLRLNTRPGKSLYTLLESLLEEIAALETPDAFPLQWICSISPLLEQTSGALDSLLVEIKTRCASRGDRLIPAGFRGAVHPLLTTEELEKELSWCWSHSAAAGFAELFAAPPAAIMPVYPDPWRELSAGAYSRQGFRALGLPQDPDRAYSFQRRGKNSRAAFFSYIPLAASTYAEYTRNLRGLSAAVPPREKVLFVVLDTDSLISCRETDGEVRPVLSRLLETLRARHAVTPVSLADPQLFASPPAQMRPLDYLPVRSDPLKRRLWLQADPLRDKAEPRDGDIRRILECLSTGPDHQSLPAAGTADPDQRVLDASMKGIVVLSGEHFDANFSDGRLAGIAIGKQRLLDAGPAQTYLELAGTRYDYRTESAFSFQGPGEHGLRSVLKLRLPRPESPGAENRLMVDCYFEENCPDLMLDFQVTYPVLDTEAEISSIAPYEIPLLAVGPEEAIRLRARFPDHSEVEHQFHPSAADEELQLLSGSEFTVGCGRHTLFLRFNGSPRVGLIEFRRRRRSSAQILYANLNGSYRAAGAGRYSGVRESFSFRIGLKP